MPARHYTRTLSCPVRDDEGDPCGQPITVEAWPGTPDSWSEPGTGPEVHVVATPKCPHLTRLEEERESDVDDLLDQLEERDRDAYEDAQESRYDNWRDRDLD